MGASTIIVGLIALVLGAVIGWLFASRESAGAKQTVASLRSQLDEVVKERDLNREAATRLAALEASQLERERGFETRITEPDYVRGASTSTCDRRVVTSRSKTWKSLPITWIATL